MAKTSYCENVVDGFIVKFLVKSSGVVLERVFRNPYACMKFVRKLEHSKKCSLISCPSLEGF